MGEKEVLMSKIVSDIKELIEKTSNSEYIIRRELNRLYSKLEKENMVNESKLVLRVIAEITDVEKKLGEYDDVFETLKRISETDNISIGENLDNDIKSNIVNKVSETDINKTLERLSNNIGEALRLIEENSKSIGMREGLKLSEDRSGENSPRYRQDVENMKLIELYRSGMDYVKLGEIFDMTPAGVINRLKNLKYDDGKPVYQRKYRKLK